MAMENTMRFLHENVFHDPEDYTRGGVVDTSDKTIYIDDKVLEVTKRQKISRLLLFTETGEGSCPLACSYCFLAKAGVNKKMSEKTLRDAIDWLRAVSRDKTPSIHFFGTEPTKNWHLIELAREYAPEMQMSMTTNGYLLNEERIKWLDENDIRIFIYSIDGSEEHNQYRVTRSGKSSWNRVSKNLQLLLKSKQAQWMTARGSWYPDDYDLVSRFKALEDLGAKSITFIPVVEAPGWDEAKVAQAYIELADYYNGGPSPSKMIEDMIQRIEQGPQSPPGNGCGTGFFSWALSPDGKLSLCQGYEEMEIGTIGSIYEGITNENAFEISRIVDDFHTERDPYPKEECKTCPAYNYCQGTGYCSSNFYLANGTFHVPPDGYCIHLRGQLTGLKYWLSKRQMNDPERNPFMRLFGRKPTEAPTEETAEAAPTLPDPMG